jgi:hypothetical protein
MVLAEGGPNSDWLWMSQKKMMSTMRQVNYRLSSGLRWFERPKPMDPSSLIMWIISLGRVSESHLQRQLRADVGMFPALAGKLDEDESDRGALSNIEQGFVMPRG